MDPVDSLKFGIKGDGKYYTDLAISFGWMHGSAGFQILSDSVAYIMAKTGIKLQCYIAIVPKSKTHEKFYKPHHHLEELGLPINLNKLTPPTKCLTCLGIDINIDTNTMSISKNKLQSIYDECVTVRTRAWLSKRSFQSFLGKFLYI